MFVSFFFFFRLSSIIFYLLFIKFVLADRINNENARKFNNCVPDDLILSIKQAEIPKEFLGPPSKRTLQNVKPTVPVRAIVSVLISGG